ncbi:MAG: hypothetical protein HS108_02905 [Planctomycetes bacterium]|jgi:hypothetical protein|nr:hypothetical protein [Planctomycetota bacterium]MCL4730110.1 hypothetical protein [Planctomycetota bacterium]
MRRIASLANPARHRTRLRWCTGITLAGLLASIFPATFCHRDLALLTPVVFFLGVAAMLVLALCHRMARGAMDRRALLATLAKPSRIHRLNRPLVRMLAAAVTQCAVGTLVVCVSVFALAKTEPMLLLATLAGGFGLCLLLAGLRRASDYDLLRDAWRDECRAGKGLPGVRQ